MIKTVLFNYLSVNLNPLMPHIKNLNEKQSATLLSQTGC